MMGREYGSLENEEVNDDFEDKRCSCDVTYHSSEENVSRGNWPFGIQGTVALLGAILGAGWFTNVAESVFLFGPIYLVPYTAYLVVFTIPVFYLESVMGQFSSSGVLTCWMIPLFKCIGVVMLAYNIPCAILQSLDTAQNLYYLHESIRSSLYNTTLPWQSYDVLNQSAPECSYNSTGTPPNEVYFNCHVLSNIASDTSGMIVNVPILMAIIIVWLLAILISAFGIRSLAWVSTVLVPVGLLILFVLSGIADSLPAEENIWTSSNTVTLNYDTGFWPALNMFLATSGVVITYSSFNRFHNDVIRDTVYILVMKYIVDILMITTLGGFLYHKAYYDGTDAHKLTSLRLDAAFAGIPNGISYSIAFFFMVFFFKILNVLALLETFVTGLSDQFPRLRDCRTVVVLLTSVILLLLSIPMATTSGPYWASIVDINLRSWLPAFLLLLMVACFIVYGVMTYFRHRHDVASMTRWHLWCIPSTAVWMLSAGLIMILLPLILLVRLGIVVQRATRSLYSDTDHWPDWASEHLSNCVAVFPFMVLIITIGIQIVLSIVCKRPDWKTLVGYAPRWDPSLSEHRSRVRKYRDMNPYSSSHYTDRSAPKRTSTPRVKQFEEKYTPFYI